jgi:hypothetical protein
MSRRALLALLGLLVVLVMVAGVLIRPATAPESTASATLLPGLKAELNDIKSVVVRSAGNAVVATLVRGKDSWQLKERGYAADAQRLGQTLVALAEAEILEEKTALPEFYSRLGVEDIKDTTAGGLELDIQAAKNRYRVILGDTTLANGTQAYARRPGEATSWLIKARLDPGKATIDWLDKLVLDIPAERFQSVTTNHPDGAIARIRKTKAEEENFQVADIPAGRSLTFDGAANGMGAALTGLNLENVERRESLGGDPGKPVVTRFVAFNGLVVETSAWRVPDGTRFTFIASSTGSAADVAKEAAAINQRLGGWVYTLPGYKAEQLTHRVSDWLEPR